MRIALIGIGKIANYQMQAINTLSRSSCLHPFHGLLPLIHGRTMDRDFPPGQVADRWVRAKRALKAGDQKYADRLADMIRAHSDDRIAPIRDPLEAAVFSLLVELVKEEEYLRDICQDRRDDQKKK